MSQTAAYDNALKNLADALVRVWTACEDGSEAAGGGIRFGGSLPEALSCALGMAAENIGLDWDAEGGSEDAELAAEGLVRHRPGSWEAAHVRALVLSPDLLSRAHADSREGRVQQLSEDELRGLGT